MSHYPRLHPSLYCSPVSLFPSIIYIDTSSLPSPPPPFPCALSWPAPPRRRRYRRRGGEGAAHADDATSRPSHPIQETERGGRHRNERVRLDWMRHEEHASIKKEAPSLPYMWLRVDGTHRETDLWLSFSRVCVSRRIYIGHFLF